MKKGITKTFRGFSLGVSSLMLTIPAACDLSGGSGTGGSNTGSSCSDELAAVLNVTCAQFEEAYIKASNTDTDDYFGLVALSGDTLAVGAPGEAGRATGVNGNQADNSAPGSGAVYVFTRSGGTWSQQAYIKASNTDSGDTFGSAIALSGDTLAVGAWREAGSSTGVNGGRQDDNSAERSGAVYVFTRTGSIWSQQAYIKASNAEAGDEFGYSIALSGDTLAVGTRLEGSSAKGVNRSESDNGAPSSGAVYVFTRSGGIWRQQAYLKASNTESGDEFGSPIALYGDTLAVGAHRESSSARGVNGSESNNNAKSSGAVYVFTRSGGTWRQQAYLKAFNTDANDYFGTSIAISGDTLAVGAQQESSSATGVNGSQDDNSAPLSGAVYVFTRSGGTWSRQAYLKASNTDSRDIFSYQIALSGDTLAVSAANEGSSAKGVNGSQRDNSAPGSGAVYLFTRSGGIWRQQAYLKASNTDKGDVFANIALSGRTLAVGALEGSSAQGINGNQSDNGAPRSGAVYIRRIAP